MLIKDTFDSFILSRRLSGLSERSIKNYKDFIEPFLLYLGNDREYESVLQNDINNYILSLMKRNISKASLATYIRHVKIFLRWSDLEYGSNYSVKAIKVPKTPKKNVYIYSENEIREIFSRIHSETEWIQIRNCAIVALMLDSGLRQGEICSLLRKNIFLQRRYIVVTGKGAKDRCVPLGNISSNYLFQYTKACPYLSETMFVNKEGGYLSCNAVKLMVSKLSSHLDFELSSHKLRHNFATNYCLDQYERYGQIDINKLTYLMGHEDSKTTQRYLHFAYEIIASKDCISHIDSVYQKAV